MEQDTPRLQSGRRFAATASSFLGALAVTCMPIAARADWPTDPTAPLSLGPSGGATIEHASVMAADGAAWVAWVDGECFASLRVQRVSPGGMLLAPGALALFTDDGCTGRDARIAACADGSVIVGAVDGSQNGGGGLLTDYRIQRLAGDGQALWGEGLLLPGVSGKVGQFLGLPCGDVLIAWNQGAIVQVARYSPAGTNVWPAPAAITSPTGSSMRIFGLVSDGADGAFVFWDVPGPYTRAILAARVTAAGVPAWAQPLIVTPGVPASSRHTDPVASTGSNGEAIVVWTEGAESAGTVVALRMQRISAAGTKLLEPHGRRLSLAATRQFSASIARDDTSGDLYVAWRDGVLSHTLRAQRMSPAGDRLWGDTGVAVTPIATSYLTHFEAKWVAGRLFVAASDIPVNPATPRVHVHRIDAAGTIEPGPWPVSGTTPAFGVHARVVGEALVVSWLEDSPGLDDDIVAQRINGDGSLGLQPGDITGDGTVSVNDLLAVINHWGPCPNPLVTCSGDIDPAPDGNGQVNIDDLLKVINNWGA